MLSVRKSVKRLTDRFLLPDEASISTRGLILKFKSTPTDSIRALLGLMNEVADLARPTDGSGRPYYRRRIPAVQDAANYDSDGAHIDLRTVSPDFVPDNRPYPNPDPELPHDVLAEAIGAFDARAASVILDSANPSQVLSLQSIAGRPLGDLWLQHLNALHDLLLEEKNYGGAGVITFQTLRSPSLAMMAFNDFFPNDPRTLISPIPGAYPGVAPGQVGQRLGDYLRDLVSAAIMQASPGYCGTNGPTVTGTFSLADSSGDYDMTQTHLVPLVYSYFDELSGDARERLIGQLLAGGIVHRPNEKDFTTAGPLPGDWERAGYVSPSGIHKDIGETENHILSMLSARYLTNQLLYQRDPNHNPDLDNRRNARAGPSCMDLVLTLLRNILRDDFSEYNAKPYQEETRWAILNLATYAYDHEVRLAARMVLDYISAHIAVSSNDLRRIVPFRRRNEKTNVTQNNGVAQFGIVDWRMGADRMVSYFAIQTGNIRAFKTKNTELVPDTTDEARPWIWGIESNGQDETKEVLSAYRLPPLIHDLFVNDLHRRFFQRLHRTPQEETEGARNCDNYELYASSPSYLITAGGQPAQYAIDPYVLDIEFGDNTQQRGVAMPTTFMATGQSAGAGTQNSAKDLIQFSYFSDRFDYTENLAFATCPEYLNYGVAPDFACGYGLYLPPWAQARLSPPFGDEPGFHFINCGSEGTAPGFYLAIYKDGDYALLEAFDTWLHPDVSFAMFQQQVKAQNAGINLRVPDQSDVIPADQGGVYVTYYGTRIEFTIWRDHARSAIPDSKAGARTTIIAYSDIHPTDRLGDAGNVTGPFLNGTILNSPREAVVEISNPFYGPTGSKIVLDLNDRVHPRRVSETGEVEQAGFNNEVWVNFGWEGPNEGDFFRPFNSLQAAAESVADGGVIKIVPGWTDERPVLTGKKRYTISVVPTGAARIGVR